MTALLAPATSMPQSFLNRRAFPRRRARGTARFRREGKALVPFKHAKLIDISQAGIGLLLKEAVRIGDELEVELTAPSGRHAALAVAEVRWAVLMPDGTYRIGCCWQHRLDFAALQQLV